MVSTSKSARTFTIFLFVEIPTPIFDYLSPNQMVTDRRKNSSFFPLEFFFLTPHLMRFTYCSMTFHQKYLLKMCVRAPPEMNNLTCMLIRLMAPLVLLCLITEQIRFRFFLPLLSTPWQCKSKLNIKFMKSEIGWMKKKKCVGSQKK